jgi:ribosome-binding protein aMBF1 (putative translation factor)
MIAQAKLSGSQSGPRRMGAPQKQLTKREAKALGEFGAFALHLAELLQERGWDHRDLAAKCQAAGIDIEEHSVRAWLRGDNMPRSHHLRPIAKVLGLEDHRHILPG